ncbi:DUF3667 domain-containing protein [Zhouia sp. PK063]|uniref:DUF3667 domain-containing protein n=1 Tax=Zhouia sp. PK063 TaxID=3373602 RepID=UPI0037BB80C5
MPNSRTNYKYRGTVCLNCKHPLEKSDIYCPNCSQLNSTKHITLSDFITEFFATIVSYDSKLRKTLQALFCKPGKITRDYINGKRLTYTNPFKFFLSLTIIYFILIGLTNNFEALNKYGNRTDEFSIFSSTDFKTWITKEKQLNHLTKKEEDSLQLIYASEYFKIIEKNNSFIGSISKKIPFFETAIKTDLVFTYQNAIDTLKVQRSFQNKIAYTATNNLEKLFQSPGYFMSYFLGKLPFVIFFFLPVFSFFVWLLYNKKKYKYADHLIFSFHNQTMYTLLLIISLIINTLTDWNSTFSFSLIFLVYLFIAMRKFYNQSIPKTFIKFVILNHIFIILAISIFAAFSLGSIFTY